VQRPRRNIELKARNLDPAASLQVCQRLGAEDRDRRVAFIGDSLVAGVADPTGMGWVGRVVAASFGLGLPLTAYNLGVRRETSEQVAARWRTETVPRLLPGTDARVVLSFGANDTTVEDGQLRVAPELSCAALAAMLQDAANLARPVLMVGPAPVDDPEQNERIRSLADAFANLCERAGAAFVSVVELLLASSVWMTQVAAGDGAHPAAEGYKVLSGLVIVAGWADWLRGE
jgi:acyl-CoA thioesterase I